MLPPEIQSKILYEYKGYTHPSARLIKDCVESYKSSYFLDYKFATYIFNRFIFSKLDTQLKEKFYHL